MRTLLLLGLLPLFQQQPPQESDPIKLFLEAINRAYPDEGAATAVATKQLAVIAGPDNESSVAKICETYRQAVKFWDESVREEKRCEKDLDEKKVVLDHQGGYVRGNALEEARAKEALQRVRSRIALLDDFIPRIALLLHGSRTEGGIKAVLARTQSAPDWYMRAHAVTALAYVESARPSLVEQLKKESEPGVKVALLDALRPQCKDNRDLVEFYVECLKDPYWQVKIAALAGIRVAAPKWAIPQLITAMKGAIERVEWDVNETLKAVTGIDKHNYDSWKAWWDANGEEFLAGRYVPSMSERAEHKGRSTFYGLEIHSDHLILILDLSSSMTVVSQYKPDTAGADPFTGTTRMDVARYELKKLLSQLKSGIKINVCIYNFVPAFFSDRMQTLGDKTRKDIGKWIDELKPQGATCTWHALRDSFDRGGTGMYNDKLGSGTFDTAVILTDGDPTGRVVAKKLFLEKTGELNRFKKVAIHAIGIEPTYNGADLLKSIAQQNYGVYIQR